MAFHKGLLETVLNAANLNEQAQESRKVLLHCISMTVTFNSTRFVDHAGRIHLHLVGEHIIALLPKLHIMQLLIYVISIRVVSLDLYIFLVMLTS